MQRQELKLKQNNYFNLKSKKTKHLKLAKKIGIECTDE